MREGRVGVIGGGVAGLTTAILLEVNDYRTTVHTTQKPLDFIDDTTRPPEFATLHAAASILPHSVTSPKVAMWTARSQRFFRALTFRAACGVRSQIHYEMFEKREVARPPYAKAVQNFKMLTARDLRSPRVPRRPGDHDLSGWRFDAYFCEAPEYIRYLYALYQHLGGSVLASAPLVSPSRLAEGGLAAYLMEPYDYDFIVNCTGASAPALLHAAVAVAGTTGWSFVDAPTATAPPSTYPHFVPLLDPTMKTKIIRGHYLKVDIKQVLADDHGRFYSYTYYPLQSEYPSHPRAGMDETLGSDVYCYPRSDAWILGGSRQEGTILESGEWSGEDTIDSRSFNRVQQLAREDWGRALSARQKEPVAIPRAIFDLNAAILLGLTKGRVDLNAIYRNNPQAVEPGIGYRFVQDSEVDGVRLECSRVLVGSSRHRYVIHNYGHGGSGFTLSWGCALDVLQILDTISNSGHDRTPMGARSRFLVGDPATASILRELTIEVLAESHPDRVAE